MSDTPWPPPLCWPEKPLTDGVVLLDRLTSADVERVVLGCTDEASQRWLPLPSPYTEAEARSFIGSREQTAEAGTELTFAIRDASEGVLAGVIGLTLRGHRHEAEVGYWMAPDRRGRRWAPRAVRLLARYALATMPVQRVEILVAPDNVASRAAAERTAAVYEGIRRCGLPSSDHEDALVYSLIAADLDAEGPAPDA